MRPSRRGGQLIELTKLANLSQGTRLFVLGVQVRVLAAVCLLLLCFINCYSVRWATLVRGNIFLVTCKCMVCEKCTNNVFVLSGAGLFHLRQALCPYLDLHHRVNSDYCTLGHFPCKKSKENNLKEDISRKPSKKYLMNIRPTH